MPSRLRTSLLALLPLLACGCGNGSPAVDPPGAGAKRAPVAIRDGLLTVREVPVEKEAATGHAETIGFELGFGVDGSLRVDLWDRKGAREGPRTTRLARTSIPVAKGERRRLVFDHRILRGREILREFVAPLGGEPAVEALKSVAPRFESGGIVEWRLRFSLPGESGGVTYSGRFSGEAVPGEGLRMTGAVRGLETASAEPGEELGLYYWLWPGPHRALAGPTEGAPEEVLIDGRRVDGSDAPGPYWTLRVTLETE